MYEIEATGGGAWTGPAFQTTFMIHFYGYSGFKLRNKLFNKLYIMNGEIAQVTVTPIVL